MSMTTTALEPFVAESASRREDDAHTAWIRAELARRAENPGKLISHDEVMTEARALIEELKTHHAHA